MFSRLYQDLPFSFWHFSWFRPLGVTVAALHVGTRQEAASGVINDPTGRPRQRWSVDDTMFQIHLQLESERNCNSGCYAADSPSVNAPLRKWRRSVNGVHHDVCFRNGNEPQSWTVIVVFDQVVEGGRLVNIRSNYSTVAALCSLLDCWFIWVNILWFDWIFWQQHKAFDRSWLSYGVSCLLLPTLNLCSAPQIYRCSFCENHADKLFTVVRLNHLISKIKAVN